MKNLLHLLSALVIFSACSKSNEATEEDTYQDYTSFVFEQTINNLLPNCVAGYFDEEGYCWKIADLGSLSKAGQQTMEVIIDDDSVHEIFFFCDLAGGVMTDEVFALKYNRKNIFKLRADVKGIQIDYNDPRKYPQEKSPE